MRNQFLGNAYFSMKILLQNDTVNVKLTLAETKATQYLPSKDFLKLGLI
jgi:hypothetical protein